MTVLAGAAAYPLLAGAQQKPMPVIGVLGGASPEVRGVQRNLAAFREGLGEMGFVEGQNVVIEYRWAERHLDRLPALAAELVARKVDVIVLEGGHSSTLAAKEATSTIPIVFNGSDPVARGLIASFARPGGNLTGVSLMISEMVPKLLEMLLEVVPEAKLIGVLRDPSSPLDIEHAASARNVRLHILPTFSSDEVDAAFAALVPLKPDGLIVSTVNRAHIAALAARHSIPAIAATRDFPENGGLLSYGPSIPAAYRIKGIYTARILKGERAADLPVQQPTRFELVINLKSAQALGITIPTSILARADEVIE